jgi:hypothetical protein
MTLGTRLDYKIVQSTIPEGKLKWLGRPPGDYEYATYGGAEYAVDRNSTADLTGYNRRPGEIIVLRVERELIDGSAFEHHRMHRAWPVESGTYAALAAKARKPAAEKPLRAWDALATLSVMQRRDPERFASTPAASDVNVGALKAQLGITHERIIEVGGNEPPERSPAAIIEHLASRGVELKLSRGRLVARSRNPMRFDDRELIEKAEELIVGVLRGQPVICSTCAEPAVSIVFPHAPMCAEHLKG